MPKVTQNRCYDSTGAIMRVGEDPQSFVSFLQTFNALRWVQAVDQDKNLLFLDENGDTTTTNTGRPFLKVRPRSGYTQYWNNDGFTNPISPESLTPQGIGKLMAKLIEVSHMIIRNGGNDATEMKAVLAGALAYNEIAANEVEKTAKQSVQAQALETLTKALGGDTEKAKAKLDEYLAKQGIKPEIPQPTVTPAEAVEAAATAEETAQDAAPEEDAVVESAVAAAAVTTEDIGEPQAVDAELSVEEESK
jgi:hypothetical protein